MSKIKPRNLRGRKRRKDGRITLLWVSHGYLLHSLCFLVSFHLACEWNSAYKLCKLAGPSFTRRSTAFYDLNKLKKKMWNYEAAITAKKILIILECTFSLLGWRKILQTHLKYFDKASLNAFHLCESPNKWKEQLPGRHAHLP